MYPSELLSRTFALPPPPNGKLTMLDRPAICAICGKPHTGGDTAYLTNSLITVTTADIADTFRHQTPIVCEDCARCFGASRVLTGAMFVEDGAAIRPMVAQTSATLERPSWRDLVRSMFDGTPNVSILTLNTKRRLWTRAVISTFGAHWQPLFVDGDTDRLLDISVPELRECLDLIEQVYSFGGKTALFSKTVIAESLYSGLSSKQLQVVSLERVTAFERQLYRWRGTDAFLAALFIAQRPETPSE